MTLLEERLALQRRAGAGCGHGIRDAHGDDAADSCRSCRQQRLALTAFPLSQKPASHREGVGFGWLITFSKSAQCHHNAEEDDGNWWLCWFCCQELGPAPSIRRKWQSSTNASQTPQSATRAARLGVSKILRISFTHTNLIAQRTPGEKAGAGVRCE